MKMTQSREVENLIVMAAGMGSRMGELTETIPKPLVKVHGKPMIEWILDAGVAAGIRHMYVVTGYQCKQFSYLMSKYENLALIYNPYYNQANNIGSVYVARDYLANSYVVEGDLVIFNQNLIQSNQSESNYVAKKVKSTLDWCFDVDEKTKVINQVKVGGMDCYHMYGISYWSKEDGARLSKVIEEDFEQEENRQLYFDEVPLKRHKNEFTVKVRPCNEGDVIEIDTYEELQEEDEAYRK